MQSTTLPTIRAILLQVNPLSIRNKSGKPGKRETLGQAVRFPPRLPSHQVEPYSIWSVMSFSRAIMELSITPLLHARCELRR